MEQDKVDLSLVKSVRDYNKPNPIEVDNPLRATLIQHPKPVQHIFSHIKKRYLPIYLVLEGGSAPPSLKPFIPSASKKEMKKKKASKKRKSSSKGVIEISDDEEEEENGEEIDGSLGAKGELKWVPEDDLEGYMYALTYLDAMSVTNTNFFQSWDLYI